MLLTSYSAGMLVLVISVAMVFEPIGSERISSFVQKGSRMAGVKDKKK